MSAKGLDKRVADTIVGQSDSALASVSALPSQLASTELLSPAALANNGLNERQIEAITAPSGPVLVVAGAGAGKTTVLTNRAAYFVEQGMNPSGIVAITFTNKAANEMRERLEKLLGPKASLMHIQTFHSYCVGILHSFLSRLHDGRDENFSILDDSDRDVIIKQVIKDLGVDEEYCKPAKVGSWISRQKDFLLKPGEHDETFNTWFPRVYEQYEAVLRERNTLDFDDLIMLTVFLLRHDEEVRRRYQTVIKALLVDEFQDVNFAQYTLTRLLSDRWKNIFVVGDPDQAIYGFRGSDYRYLMLFKQDFLDANTITLEQNYRSTPVILEATNAMIRNNRDRMPKDLWTEKQLGHLIRVTGYDNNYLEAEDVANQIAALRIDGIHYEDMAILYRNGSLSSNMQEALIMAKIPHRVFGGLDFLSRKEVKDVLSFIRLVHNPKDITALQRVINFPPRGIGDKSQREVLQALKGKDLFQSGDSVVSILPAATGEKFRSFVTCLEKAKEMNENECPPADVILFLVKELGCLDYYEDRAKKAKSETDCKLFLNRIENISTLIKTARDACLDGNLQDFLEYIALQNEKKEEGDDKVSLMTCHRAKGLEFRVVFVIGMEEDIIPGNHSHGNPDEIEEERRIAYVAMTRAKEKLFLSYSYSRFMYQRCFDMMPSRFLRELPENCVEDF